MLQTKRAWFPMSNNIHADICVPGGLGTVWWASAASPCRLWPRGFSSVRVCITGSDMRESATVEHLRSPRHPNIHRPATAANVGDVDLIIRTAAVRRRQPWRISEARAAGDPGL